MVGSDTFLPKLTQRQMYYFHESPGLLLFVFLFLVLLFLIFFFLQLLRFVLFVFIFGLLFLCGACDLLQTETKGKRVNLRVFLSTIRIVRLFGYQRCTKRIIICQSSNESIAQNEFMSIALHIVVFCLCKQEQLKKIPQVWQHFCCRYLHALQWMA